MAEPPIDPAYRDAVATGLKRELRKRMRAIRRSLPASAIAARSKEIIDRIVLLDVWAGARTVALFMSMPDEVQLEPLIRIAREEGRRVALPVVLESRVLTFRAPYAGNVEHGMVTSAFGVSEPSEDAPEVPLDEIDLVIVPALALDARGHRLGYGGGYYDHTLPLATRAVRVGVSFEFQMIVEVPARETDVPVHWIVTDQRTLRAEP